MRLTEKEKEICRKYGSYWVDNKVHCSECPLSIDKRAFVCYANIDGRTKEAKELKRYE